MTTVWCHSVLKFIIQVPHPFAPVLVVGAPHLKDLHSSVIELVWHSVVFLLAHWTLCSAQFAVALLTEKVPTAGLQWFTDNAVTNGALQLLEADF